MTYKTIILELDGPVATIILNRPESLNALTHGSFKEIGDAIGEINSMSDIRAVIIKGSGRAFSAGTDLKSLKGGEGGDVDRSHWGYRFRLYALQENLFRIERLEKPVIAQVHGYALGAALELVLTCDFRISTEDTRFALPEVLYGIIPDLGGSQRLIKSVGLLKAKELVMLGRHIDGMEAQNIGLVNKAVPAADLESEVSKLVEEIVRLPPLPIGLAKRNLDKALDMDLVSSLDETCQIQSMLLQTEDFKEGVQAKLEKRDPVFKGK